MFFRIHYDIARQQWVRSDKDPRLFTGLVIKRDSNLPIEVRFLNNGFITSIGESATGTWEVKKLGQYESTPPLASSLNWRTVPDQSGPLYAFDVDTNTTSIDDLLGVDGDPLNDVQQVEVMGEILINDGTLSWRTSDLKVFLQNSIV